MKRSMQRVISSALALSMMASVVPTSALALAPAADPAGIAAQVEDSKELSGDGALAIVNGRPDLSQALKQEGTVYYGNGWNYDQSTDTLTLTESPEGENVHGWKLGTTASPMRCKVVIGEADNRVWVDDGYFANDVLLRGGEVYRGVFYYGSHFTTEDQDEQAVGYCVFANPPVGVAYSTVTTKDPALAAKMETCMSPNYAANFRLSGGTVYVTAGQYHWFGIFGIDENDVTDINGQKLELTKDEESGSLKGELKDTSGETTIAGIIVGSAEMVKETFPDVPEKPVLFIHPLDEDSHVYELNQNYKPEEEDKGALTLVNGRPDLSQALKQEGTVYYGTNWNYDTNSETLTLTGNQSDAAGNWILGTLADPVRCDVVIGTAETKVVVEGGCFRGTVRVVNGKVGGVFQGRFINEMKDAQPDDMGYMVFTNEPEGVSYSTVRTRDGSFASKMQVGLDPDYMWTDDSGKDPHVYVTAGKNHYFMLMGVSKGELLDVNGCVLNLHENTEEDACDADSEFLAAGALVDVLKDASGNKFAKVYYLPADVASGFDNRVNEEVFLFVPLDDTSREYNLNELSSSMMGLSIKNGKPDLSYALRQDGSMYYGKSWSYDASSDTLTFLQGKDDMDEGRVSDVGTEADPVTSKVVIEKYNYVFNCHFAGEVINRGRMDVCTITGPLTNEGGEVDYCGFTTPPSGMNYQTLRMDDELVSKAEITFAPEWLEESVITGNPLYFVAGETGPIYLWKLAPSDIKDINGQTLTFEESPEEEEEGVFRAALMDESGSKQIAWIYYAPEGRMEADYDRSDSLILIGPLDDDSHVYELNQNYKPEEEDKTISKIDPDAIAAGNVAGLKKTDAGLTLKEGYKMELPDDTVVSDNIENKGTIVSGTFEGTVTGGEIAGGSVQKANGVDNISGGNVQEAKDVKEISGGNVEILENADKISGGNVQEAKDVREISGGNIGAVEKVEKISGGNVQAAKDVKEITGGTVAYVEDVESITGGVIGGQSVLSDEIKEKADVLNLVNADGTPLLDGAVNDVIVPQGAAAVALFSMENGVDEEPLTPVAYIFDSTKVTVRYTGSNAAFKGWTSDDVTLEGTGSTVSFSMENVTGKTIALKAVYTNESTEQPGTPEQPSQPDQPDTPDQPEEKEPEYTITVEDGQINGKASATVKAGDTVSLTVGEVPESMAFLYWDIPTELMQALTEQDVNFNNKAENLTFKMPKLAESAEKSFTIRAAFGTAETADDGDHSALGVVTGVVAGGAAATVVGWQLYNIGTDLYLQAVLPKGAAIPTNRQELALLLWQNAGKPEAVTASYADIANDQTDAQKAARWAVANGLLDAAGEDATVFAPAKSVSRLTVIKAWNKAQKLKKQ